MEENGDTDKRKHEELQFLPNTMGELNFKVRAEQEAKILLVSNISDRNNVYEIVIGSNNNGKASIECEVKNLTPGKIFIKDLLNREEYRGFWITWNNGTIALGKKGKNDPLIKMKDPEPYGIGYYGVSTLWDVTGEWIFEDGEEIISTPKIYIYPMKHTITEFDTYNFRPFLRGCVKVVVNSSSNVSVFLTNDSLKAEQVYEIVIGTVSSIFCNYQTIEKVKADTPGILDYGKEKVFYIKWNYGLISLESNSEPLLQWKDPNPIGISFYGGEKYMLESGALKLINVPCSFTTGDKNISTEDDKDGKDVKELEKVVSNILYKFFPVTSGSISFEIRAHADVEIALTPNPAEVNDMYEVYLGSWNNKRTIFQRSGIVSKNIKTPGLLNENEFRGFWIRWHMGTISVGKDKENNSFADWNDEHPFGIGYFGNRTYNGPPDEWIIERSQKLSTTEYKFRPVPTGCLKLKIRAPSDAWICLSDNVQGTEHVYEIIIGGWGNSASAIRLNRQVLNETKVKTPGILDDSIEKEFKLKWNRGSLYLESEGKRIVEWRDPDPFGISYFGIEKDWEESQKLKVSCEQFLDSDK